MFFFHLPSGFHHGSVDPGTAVARRCPTSDAGALWAAFSYRGATLPVTVDRGTIVVCI